MLDATGSKPARRGTALSRCRKHGGQVWQPCLMHVLLDDRPNVLEEQVRAAGFSGKSDNLVEETTPEQRMRREIKAHRILISVAATQSRSKTAVTCQRTHVRNMGRWLRVLLPRNPS